MKIVAAQKMPDRHFYLLRHHILFYLYFWFSVYWCQIEINILIWRKRSLPRRLWVYDFCILNTLRSLIWDRVFFLFSDYLNLQLVRMGIFQKDMTFQEVKFQETDIYNIRNSISSVGISCYFLMENFSLVNSHNLLGNPLIHIQNLNTNFHLEPKHRKAEIW